jgi:pimeloyl-ACP methyl ester carboxylesterase
MRNLVPRARRVRLWTVLALALVLTSAAYFAWSAMTSVRGTQTVAFEPARQECGVRGPLRFCINKSARGVNGDVVYHLHGRNMDERVWNDNSYLTAMLQAHWQDGGVKPPTVVTVSYGPVWLLAPKGQLKDSGLLEDFMQRLPEIEAVVGEPTRRMLVGESMGGLNALILGLTQHTQFTKVAALCPGVYADSPFSSLATLKAGAERTGANPKIILGIVQLAKAHFANEGEWRRASPLQLIEGAGAHFPHLFLSCGLYDAYGNFEGTQRLARRAAQLGVKVEWHPIYGGHCATDIASLGNFLLR